MVTASQLLIMLGIVLVSHDLKPAARVFIGATLGLWGCLCFLGSLLY